MEALEASGSITNASPSEAIVSFLGHENFQGQRGGFPSTCKKAGCAGTVDRKREWEEAIKSRKKMGSVTQEILSVEMREEKKNSSTPPVQMKKHLIERSL